MLPMCLRKLRAAFFDSIANVSSAYLFHIFDGRLNVVMAIFSKFSMNMLATTEDHGEPMENPSVCAYIFSPKWNTVDFKESEHSSIRSVADSCVPCVNSASLSNFCWIISRD